MLQMFYDAFSGYTVNPQIFAPFIFAGK